jgi:hypothetical protein
MSRLVEGAGENREVRPREILGTRDYLSGARVEAHKEEEGGSWGKHGFPHASEPKAREQSA